ncbi:MAG TPA: hypothetical protein ENJ53_09725 [Phaeodactylibacter sp.]|nr:hypothetical protein [Phaeodactylibacter sp.]
MKKQVRLTAKETSATNRDFYNLFRPIAPSLDIIGKVAQVISAITEAVTIWHITQTEMADYSKVVAVTVSLIATLLVVAILELGGRKFLQVVTRALVWKRLKNTWYILLFAIVTIITVGMGVLSFRLSTNGIQHAFVSNVPVTIDIDNVGIKSDYRKDVAMITKEFDKEWALIKENHQDEVASTIENYDAQIAAAALKEKSFSQKYRAGAKWAKSHIDKYRKQEALLLLKKTKVIAALKADQTKKFESWRKRKNNAIANEKKDMKSTIATAISKQDKINSSKMSNATFWGALFSWLVGFSVVLAFICIVTVEVYRRGSGIQVEYEEEEKDDSILEMIWKGIVIRFDNFFRIRAERFANMASSNAPQQRSIGFNYPRPTINNELENELPSS